ncbi:OmpA family protein [Zavarzinia sp.]|uniref:OmpA family protein n=1 Tax=Zavarzinia sp. TaxID=2027920 RepID=UPI0035652362
MRITLGLVSAAAIMVAGAAAHADRVGPYISAFGGYVIQPSLDFKDAGDPEKYTYDNENGWAAGGAFGYDFGGPRVEAEVTYRHNSGDKAKGNMGYNEPNVTGDLSSLALMLNVLYDFENSSRFTPYIGAGAGVAWIYANKLDGFYDDDDTQFAYQGIAGVKVAITGGLSLFVDYRYFATLDPKFTNVTGASSDGEYSTHNIMAGLTYNFGVAPAAPVAAPAAAPAPAAEVARSYIVFFDWNSTVITPEAKAIIADAANAATSLGVARIELTGHADRSGSARYNQKLSLKRADAVKAVLVGMGVPAAGITTIGKGESAPLVPTPDGVREPQNRRVEIVLQ